jgi:beta-lactamase class A
MRFVSNMMTLALVLTIVGTPVRSQSKKNAGGGTEHMRSQIESIRSAFPGNMAVYMKNLQTGEEITIDADSTFETFSVIKVAILAEVFHQAETGKFSLDQRLELKPGDQRLPAGVLYTLQPGLTPTIRDLLTLMIIISDNETTDLLADKVTRARVTEYMQELGLANTSIQYSDLDGDRKWLSSMDASYSAASGDKTLQFPFDKYTDSQVQHAFGETIYNPGIYFGHSTARELGHLFEMIQQKKLVSAPASEWMLATLEKQQVNNRFPKYLRDVVIAHKTGDGQPFIANDAGIIFVKNQPIVLVVLTGHHRGDTESLHDTVARVAALVGQYYGARLSPDYKPI